MNCPYCNSKVITSVKSGDLVVQEAKITGSWKTYDEGIVHYVCDKEHHFFGYSEKNANDNAEQTRTAKAF